VLKKLLERLDPRDGDVHTILIGLLVLALGVPLAGLMRMMGSRSKDASETQIGAAGTGGMLQRSLGRRSAPVRKRAPVQAVSSVPGDNGGALTGAADEAGRRLSLSPGLDHAGSASTTAGSHGELPGSGDAGKDAVSAAERGSQEALKLQAKGFSDSTAAAKNQGSLPPGMEGMIAQAMGAAQQAAAPAAVSGAVPQRAGGSVKTGKSEVSAAAPTLPGKDVKGASGKAGGGPSMRSSARAGGDRPGAAAEAQAPASGPTGPEPLQLGALPQMHALGSGRSGGSPGGSAAAPVYGSGAGGASSALSAPAGAVSGAKAAAGTGGGGGGGPFVPGEEGKGYGSTLAEDLERVSKSVGLKEYVCVDYQNRNHCTPLTRCMDRASSGLEDMSRCVDRGGYWYDCWKGSDLERLGIGVDRLDRRDQFKSDCRRDVPDRLIIEYDEGPPEKIVWSDTPAQEKSRFNRDVDKMYRDIDEMLEKHR